MFIIPAGKRLNWRRPPLATLLLVLLNVLAFIFIQGDDTKRMEAAMKFYAHSSLPATELARFVDYLESTGREMPPDARAQTRKSRVQYALVMEMESDAAFMRKLRAGEIVRPDEAEYARWREDRAHFEEMEHSVSVMRFGFRPATPTLDGVLGHMFMHGDFGHLFGNMLFLFLIGVMVEQVLGKWLFLFSYFVGGLCAVGLFGAVYADSNTPLVGASGAVAGLMGLYTICFGTRRVEFFYSLLFYFDYVKAPAILLLPLWLGNEFFQLFWNEGSHIAYMAHIGGLAGGALLGVGYRLGLPQRFERFHSAEEEEGDAFEAEYLRGQKLLGQMQFDQARLVFVGLLAKQPDNRMLIEKIYAVAKLRPDTDGYHQAAARVFAIGGDDAETARLVHDTYAEYVKTAKPQPRFTPEVLMSLATRFARAGYTADAEKLSTYLMRKQPDNRALPDLLLSLGKAYLRAGNAPKGRAFLETLGRLYPDAKETTFAAGLLKEL